MHDYIFLILPILILWSWLLPIGFSSRRVEGAVIQILPIPMLSRLKRHAISTVITTFTACSLAILDLASPWWIVVAVISAASLVSLPQSYVLTTRGIRTGLGNFHRWTEFAGVHRSAAGATLQTIRRGPGFPIWLSGSRDDDEFVHQLRSLIRDSYKGKLAPAPTELSSPVATVVAEVPAVSTYIRQN
jgi:hypothetical protein